MPEVGKTYRMGNFLFRVDLVRDGEVYFVRFRVDDTVPLGKAARVDLDVWQREMAEAKPC